jgi:hypothetical protein
MRTSLDLRTVDGEYSRGSFAYSILAHAHLGDELPNSSQRGFALSLMSLPLMLRDNAPVIAKTLRQLAEAVTARVGASMLCFLPYPDLGHSDTGTFVSRETRASFRRDWQRGLDCSDTMEIHPSC